MTAMMESTAANLISTMFRIQNGLNTKSYDSAWIEKGKTEEFDYAMAAGDEVHEFLRSLPFQWWTKDKEDRQNQVTELVDAWHFIMSQAIIDHDGNVNRAIAATLESYENSEESMWAVDSNMTVKRVAKRLVAALYAHNSTFTIPVSYMEAFFDLCSSAEVRLELLYARYLAKATLNKFRVENGYKQGTYKKVWEIGSEKGEDNFFLSRWVDNKLAAGEMIPSEEEVYGYLTVAYGMACGTVEFSGAAS